MSSDVVALPRPLLGTIEQVIYDRLQAAAMTDFEQPISVLFSAAFDVRHSDLPSSRNQQQRLGPYIARLNTKLGLKERIVPGVARRTYRLEPVSVEG